MKVKLTFTEPLLGTLSGNKEVAEEFIASKHPDGIQQDELVAMRELNEQIEKSSTIFSRNGDDEPILWDYQIKGFFKDACSMLRRAIPATKWPTALTAYKKVIDGNIFVKPRKITLNLSGDLTFTERPLRGQTPKGERISLARSETAPIGTTIEFEIILLNPKLEKYMVNWLDYGALRGLGQWRNSGMGRFTWERIPD